MLHLLLIVLLDFIEFLELKLNEVLLNIEQVDQAQKLLVLQENIALLIQNINFLVHLELFLMEIKVHVQPQQQDFGLHRVKQALI